MVTLTLLLFLFGGSIGQAWSLGEPPATRELRWGRGLSAEPGVVGGSQGRGGCEDGLTGRSSDVSRPTSHAVPLSSHLLDWVWQLQAPERSESSRV